MGKVAFYLLHGLEVRHFLLSGLLEKEAEQNEVILIIGEKVDSPLLKEYLATYRVTLINLPIIEIKKSGVAIEAGIRSIRDARKRRKKLGIYNHLKKGQNGNSITDFIKGNVFSHYFSDIIGRRYLSKQRTSGIILNFVKEQKISKLYLVDFGTAITKLFINVCVHQKVEINVFVNSLKSVFIDDFIPFTFNKFNTWNFAQQILFTTANPGLNKNIIVATGLPYHNFLRQFNEEQIKKVIKKYDLPVSRPIIVYSLIFEKVFSKEHLIIEKINNYFIETFDIAIRPIIVLRRNPFEENTYGIKYLSALENIIIANHNWERNVQKAWTIQSLEGELEWRAFLQLSAINMNIPSMSTIDSLICGTPVVNIAFDENEEENKMIPHIINAPFIKEFEKSKFVKTFSTFRAFKKALPDLLYLKVNTPIKELQSSIDIIQSDLSTFI